MDLQKGIPLTQQSSEQIIEALDQCVVCGEKLKYFYKTDQILKQVHEEGRCDWCKIRTKQNVFILH